LRSNSIDYICIRSFSGLLSIRQIDLVINPVDSLPSLTFDSRTLNKLISIIAKAFCCCITTLHEKVGLFAKYKTCESKEVACTQFIKGSPEKIEKVTDKGNGSNENLTEIIDNSIKSHIIHNQNEKESVGDEEPPRFAIPLTLILIVIMFITVFGTTFLLRVL
jgi:hypothetical protein